MNRVLLKGISEQISSGLTPLRSNKEYWASPDVPWIKTEQLGIKNIYDSNERISRAALDKTTIKLNPVNTISIAMYGEGKTRGRVSILRKEMATNQACCNVVINSEEADYEYVYYFLITQYKELRNLSSGVRKNLNSSDIKNFEVRLPNSRDYQRVVSKVFSDLDEKIEINNKINTELEAMAKLIYDYWFLQFDFPDENGKPYKSSGGKMVYNDKLKREIPEGWECGSIGDVATLIRGVTYSEGDIKNVSDDDVIPILRATNISDNTIDLDRMVYLPKSLVSTKQVLNKYDVLITMSSGSKDHIGKNGMFYFDEEVSFGAFCGKLVAKENFQYYVFSYAQSDFMSKTIKNECLGTNINNLNGELVNNFKLPLPKTSVLDEFNLQLAPLFKAIGMRQKENHKLTELKDWLLPMLMNGQVTVE